MEETEIMNNVVDITLRPVEIMRAKNIIRGRATELGLDSGAVTFSDELAGGKRLPCSGFEPMTISVIVRKNPEKKELLQEFLNWIQNKWK